MQEANEKPENEAARAVKQKKSRTSDANVNKTFNNRQILEEQMITSTNILQLIEFEGKIVVKNLEKNKFKELL